MGCMVQVGYLYLTDQPRLQQLMTYIGLSGNQPMS